MLLQATGDVYNPTAGEIALMLASATIFFLILFWRRLAPRGPNWDDHIKKAWFMLSTEEQNRATKLYIVEVTKSDADENEAIFEEITVSHKKAAQKMTKEDMYSVLKGLSPELHTSIVQALQTLLNADGEFAPEEAKWLAEVVDRLTNKERETCFRTTSTAGSFRGSLSSRLRFLKLLPFSSLGLTLSWTRAFSSPSLWVFWASGSQAGSTSG